MQHDHISKDSFPIDLPYDLSTFSDNLRMNRFKEGEFFTILIAPIPNIKASPILFICLIILEGLKRLNYGKVAWKISYETSIHKSIGW